MLLTPAEIEKAAKRAGMTLPELYERARIARSTFERWRNGLHQPQLATVIQINAALRGEQVKPTRKKRRAA
ncbi:MAG: helix-turn-helix transcriptional regulator [Rhodocyclaceae bacterium]|nr:helix-turn-helix transcriptional regulator [Rhodocyclaceae bacterium]